MSHAARILAVVFSMASCFSAHAEGRPNIVIVLADDFGPGDVGCYGGKVPTPALDRMAAEGTRFMRFHVASPICSPSRCGIITGQWPARWRITSYLQTRKGNAQCGQADFLDAKAPSLPRALKAAGYATAHVGKWHLGGGRDVANAPKFDAYGYDLGRGTWESPEPDLEIDGPEPTVKRWERTRWMVDQTLDFLRKHEDKPCFVNLWLDDTHTPWVPEAGAKKGNPEENYTKVLVEMDRQLGRFMDELRKPGARRETLVIFFGDNGPLPTFGQMRTGGLRGSKLSLYEGGTRVPCIAWQPGKIPAGRVDEDTTFVTIDLFPTLCAQAGAALPDGYEPDGEDMSRALRGQSVKRTKTVFFEYGRNPTAYVYPEGRNRSPNVAVIDGSWKLLVNDDASSVELYDLASDAKESVNLAAEKPDVASRLSRMALEWRKAW